MSEDEVEEEFEKALKANEAKKDNCATPMPVNKEVGVQRQNVKLKKD